MLYLFIRISVQFYIKHLNDNLYMGDEIESRPGRDIVPVEKGQRVNFLITNDKDGYLYITPEHKGHIFTVGDEWTLTYDAIYYKLNQKFKLEVIRPGIYLIQNRGKCVEFVPEDQRYITNECTDSIYQMFYIFGTEEEQNSFRLRISEGSYVDSQSMGYNKEKLPVINISSEKIDNYLRHMNMKKKLPGEFRNRNHHAVSESNKHSEDNLVEEKEAASGAFGEAGIYNNVGASSSASASGNQGIYGDSSISGEFRSSKYHKHFGNPGHPGRFGHHENPGKYGHFGKSVKYGDSSAASISSAASFAKANDIASADSISVSGNYSGEDNFGEHNSHAYSGGYIHHKHFGNPGHPGRYGYHVYPDYSHPREY